MNKYISLSKYPGRQGLYYYTEFFKRYNIDAVYEPIGTDNLIEELSKARVQGVKGISVSMPFKQEIIKHLDELDISVAEYDTCNTVVIDRGILRGYNCDYSGAQRVLQDITIEDTVTVLGAGSMGSMIFKMLGHNAHLASPRLGNWADRHRPATVIINCTNQGTVSPASPLDYIPEGCRLIIDLTVNDCDLALQAAKAGVKYISGQEFYKYQFMDQFRLYTGKTVNPDDYDSVRLARK
jgi:shikimate dehydrogenase